jgi:hypothetical protein
MRQAPTLPLLVVMDDVIYVGMPSCEEHLRSKYLDFESSCDGHLDDYLAGLATSIPHHLDAIWVTLRWLSGSSGSLCVRRVHEGLPDRDDLLFRGRQ